MKAEYLLDHIINITELGRMMAHLSDVKQAEIINAMASEFNIISGSPFHTMGDMEMQICFISKLLSKSGRELIKSLATFVELEEKESEVAP